MWGSVSSPLFQWQCPEFDPCGSCGSHDHLYSNSELEQVVVLLLLGRELLKEWGVFLSK